MNIALIRPPKISGVFEKILIQEPINILYLATFLKNKGFGVSIWDFEVEDYNPDIIKKRIETENISIAGITSMTPTIKNAHNVAQLLKKLDPKIKTVAGGPHVSALPEESLRNFPAFDYIVITEGEIAFSKLCQAIKEKKTPAAIPGIAYRKNNNILVNTPTAPIENLDSLPFPDRSLLCPEQYKHIYAAGINMSGKRSTVVFTSRGCSQDCTFCAVKKTSGPKVRFRSAENVIQELTECKDKYGYNHITFEDTNFTLDRNRFFKICDGLKSLGLTWDCQTKVSFVDKEFIKKMADCGCLKIAYGVESGSPKMLKLMKKNITIDQVKKAFKLTHKAGLVACGFFILGTHPDEDIEDIKQTEQLIRQIKPDIFQLGIICPYPGTEIYSIMKKEGMIKDIDWSKFNFMHSTPHWGTKHVSAEKLTKLQKQIYLRYVFSPGFLLSLLKKLKDPREIIHLAKLGGYLFSYLFLEKRK
ncbi:MAG: radical SAM protein [PVC group bacterium]|nr:radical SAM protein [PVC group bacterium]